MLSSKAGMSGKAARTGFVRFASRKVGIRCFTINAISTVTPNNLAANWTPITDIGRIKSIKVCLRKSADSAALNIVRSVRVN